MANSHKNAQRFWELDALRGVAILVMIAYHLVFDLVWFGLADLQLWSWPWVIAQRIGLVTFALLYGMSLQLKWQALERRGVSHWLKVHHFFKRAALLMGCGLVITLVTWLFAPQQTIVFGVLHFFSITTLVALPILILSEVTLWPLGVISLIAATLVMSWFPASQQVDHYWLVWLGWVPAHFESLDHVPLVPWIGVVLFGMLLGDILYKNGRRQFILPIWLERWRNRGLEFLGQHSLEIYLLHQPVLVLTLLFVQKISR